MSDAAQVLSAHTAISRPDFSQVLGMVLRINAAVQASNMDGEMVLLGLSTGPYYTPSSR